MKDEFDLKIADDGTIQTLYQDGIEKFAEDLGADIAGVCRASNVEWEEGDQKGWTVRAVKDPELALRWVWDEIAVSSDSEYPLVFFLTRESAIKSEIEHFWELIEK